MNLEPLALLEKTVVGAVVYNPGLLDKISLQPRHFCDFRAQQVWECYTRLRDAGRKIDATTVTAELVASGAHVSTSAMFADALLYAAADANALEAESAIMAEYQHREALATLSEALEAGRRGELRGEALIAATEQRLGAIKATEQASDQAPHIGSLVAEFVRNLSQRVRDGARTNTGYPTGVEMLDGVIGGWQPRILNVICARPSHGKSSLLMSTTDACVRAGYGVHVFSMEDPRERYVARAIARQSKLSTSVIATGKYNPFEYERVKDALQRFNKGQWIVDDRSGISAEEIIRQVRKHRDKNKTEVVCIDYLNIMRRPDGARSVHEAISNIVNLLADWAKNENLCVVLATQLNRAVEKQDEKRPIAADIRESGTVEERAKLIVATYYAYKHLPPLPPDAPPSKIADYERAKRQLEIIVLKNSNGESNVSRVVNFDPESVRVW